ncbi:MAG: hypothetical protein RJA10_3551 [Pseudomonadota bacterium]|jgi:uncharacterized protein (TIGR00369 family)
MSDSPAAAAAVPAGFRLFRAEEGFIAANGPLYFRKDEGLFQMGFRVEPRHANPMGILHGGMMATFCDMLLPMSALWLGAVGKRFLPTISLQIDYLGPSPVGAWVQGEGQVLRTTRTLVFAQGLVQADGAPVARVSGVFKIGPEFDRNRGVAPPAGTAAGG